jgi:NodT family efflux transporter outer membrane factor (OMF) lipoprotein
MNSASRAFTFRSRPLRLRPLAAATLAALLSACAAVGPDFRSPDAPMSGRYTENALPAETAATGMRGGEAQRFQTSAEIPARWWELFRSPELDKLVRDAMSSSPSLQAAQAALRQAQENLNAQTSVLYPSVDATLGARRQQTSGASFGIPSMPSNTFTLYNASVNVQYSLDLAGGARRELEALQAQIAYQQYQIEAAYLALSGNVATAAFQEASLRAQLRATNEIIDAQDRQVQMIEKQFEFGAVARPDVLAQRAQLAQTRASLPPLQKALAQTRNQLAVLTGKLPSEAGLPELNLDVFTLPQTLPVSLPSDLVRQRPDIRAAEALLHQASARIGVAEAGKFPQLTLSASLGSAATAASGLFGAGSTLWNIGGSLLQPIFHAGRLQAQQRGAVATYDLAFAQYRQTVLGAFQNVADVLLALEMDALALKAQAEAEASARESLEMVEQQMKLGAANQLALLNAQRQYQQARIGLVQAQAQRYADTAALFQALGGGWWHRQGQTQAQTQGQALPVSDNKVQ